MTEQPLDFRRLVAVLRRNSVAFLACVCVAVLAAVVFSVLAPPPFTARSLVLLPGSSIDANGAPTRDVQTQVRIASSTDVLNLAARSLRPVPSIPQLRDRVHVTAPTPDLLQFTAHASSKRVAEETADQVAKSYVVTAQRGTSELLKGVVAALKAQAHGLSTQATALQTQIDAATQALSLLPPNGAAAASQAARIDSLRSQQGNVASQLLNVTSQISAVQLNSAVANSGTKILQHASSATNPALAAGLRNSGIGLLLGLLVGSILALALDGRDHRLRRRDDIARAAGVPAIASVATRVARSAEERLALIAGYEPSVDESFGMRWTLRHLLTTHETIPARATIVLLAGDERARMAPLQFAAFSARAGVRTALLDEASRGVSALSDAPRATEAGRESVLPNLWLLDSRAHGAAIDQLAPQLVIRVLVNDSAGLEPEEPDQGLTTTLLAVSSGFATSEAVMLVASAATESGRSLFGVIVANPEPGDETSGRVPAREGSTGPRLPARVTRSARSSR